MDSLSAVVASSCTPQPSAPAASSRPHCAPAGATKCAGSRAHKAALPMQETAAMAKMMDATGSLEPRLRMHSFAAAENTACAAQGGGDGG